ncbi:MAG: hypothetical protein ACI9R3_000113 [Verrucomicrobiales bacterium]|jgi:hypothetical protein
MLNLSKLSARLAVARFLLAVLAAGTMGCVNTDPWAAYQNLDPNGNIFVQGYGNQRPRYGHGGTESPSARKAREEQERRAAAAAERERRKELERQDARARRARDLERERSRELQPLDSLADDRPELPSGIDEIAPQQQDPEPLPEVEAEPPPPPKPTPTQQTLAYGRPVPGKPGMVYSPYSPDAGYVDVRGIAPGTKVKCPYTKKLFRVP